MELRTPRLRLRPYEPGDFETVFEQLVLDPVVTALWDDYADPALTVDGRRAMAERDVGSWIEESLALGLPTWVIEAVDPEVADPGAFVGAVGLYPPGTDLGPEPEVGCLLASRHHGRGLGTEALGAVVADALGRLELAAVAAVVDERNVPSVRMVERLGFALEQRFSDEDGHPCRRYLRRSAG